MSALRSIIDGVPGAPPILAEDPGPRRCRNNDCDAEVAPVRLRSGGYMVREICEPCRRRGQERELRADDARQRLAQAVEQLPRRFQWADLGKAERTPAPPSPELAQGSDGVLVIPSALAPQARVLREWVPGGGRGLLLHGPVGSGKTALLAGAFVHAAGRGLRGRWTSERSYLQSLRAAVSEPGRSGPTPSDVFAGVDFVVLDELGSTDAVTAWNRDRMEELICHAYDDGIPLWVSTNRPPDGSKGGLRKALGERAFTRLLEMTTQLQIAAGCWRPE